MQRGHVSPAGAVHWPALAAVTAATALGWATLLAIGPAGLEAICGAGSARLGATLIWALMAATMMLPCAVHEIGDAAQRGWHAAATYALGCMALPTAIAVVAGALLAPVHIGPSILLAIAGIALASEAAWEPSAGNRFGSAIAMVCLQLIGGAMNLGWMALIAVWMLALALAPARRFATAAAAIALLGLAAFGNL